MIQLVPQDSGNVFLRKMLDIAISLLPAWL